MLPTPFHYLFVLDQSEVHFVSIKHTLHFSSSLLFSVLKQLLWIYENNPIRSGECVGCPVQDLFVHSQTVGGKSGVQSSLFNPIPYLLCHEPPKNINNYILSWFQRTQSQSHNLNQALNSEILSLHWALSLLWSGVLSKVVNIYCFVIPSY